MVKYWHAINYISYEFYLAGTVAYRSAFFGSGTGPIYGQAKCNGNSRLISDCIFPLGIHECDHSNDAGVTCLGLLID